MQNSSLALCLSCAALPAQTAIHAWELKEIELRSSAKYANPYTFAWFNTQSGEWQTGAALRADANGEMQLPPFPGGLDVADTDWAAKITAQKGAN